MAAPAKQKRNVTAILALKTVGATAAEAATGVTAAGEIADDIETNNQLRGLLVNLRSELQSGAGDKPRREELVAQLAGLVARLG